MNTLIKKQRKLRITILLIICLLFVTMRTRLVLISIPLLLMTLAAGIATGAFIVITLIIKNDKKDLKNY